MTAEIYLNEIKSIKENIRQYTEDSKYINIVCEQLTGIDYSKDRIQTTPQNAIESAAWKMIERQNKIGDLIARELVKLDEHKSVINKLESAKHRKVLYDIYVLEMSIKEVAASIGYSENHTSRLHVEALEMVVIP